MQINLIKLNIYQSRAEEQGLRKIPAEESQFSQFGQILARWKREGRSLVRNASGRSLDGGEDRRSG